MRSAEVIIAGFSTTCLLEAYGMGKKILYANFCDTNKYHVDFKPDIVFEGTENSYEYFEARLDALRTISNEDYSREHKATMKYYMSNPLIKSTQNAIRNNLLNLILSEQSSARESAWDRICIACDALLISFTGYLYNSILLVWNAELASWLKG